MTKIKAYGVVAKGNGEAWIIDERHTALACGGGMAGQSYPCVLEIRNDCDTEEIFGCEGEGHRDFTDH